MTPDKEPIFIKATEGVDFDDPRSIETWAATVFAESLVALEALQGAEAHDRSSQPETSDGPTILELVEAYDRGDIDYESLRLQLTGHSTGGLEYENEDPSEVHDTPPLSEDNRCWLYDSERLTEEQVAELDALLG